MTDEELIRAAEISGVKDFVDRHGLMVLIVQRGTWRSIICLHATKYRYCSWRKMIFNCDFWMSPLAACG